ncbi:MAG: cytidylate kinase family protein [Candidatus Diapherotrites archaeon]
MKIPFPILISGFIGSGKSTLAQKLARTFRATYVSASHIHQKIIIEKMKLNKTKKIEHGFWETKEGKKGTELRGKELSIDKEVDKRLLQLLNSKKNIVSDARLMPWLYKGKAIRIWLSAPEKTRAKRVGERDGIPARDARMSIRKRMKTDVGIFTKLYHIRMGEDLTPFDLVMNNEGMAPQETYAVVHTYLTRRLSLRK